MALPALVGGPPTEPVIAHQATHGLGQNVISGAQSIRPGVPKARDGTIDQSGIDLLEDVIAKSQFVHNARTVIFHNDVCFLNHLAKELFALRGL